MVSPRMLTSAMGILVVAAVTGCGTSANRSRTAPRPRPAPLRHTPAARLEPTVGHAQTVRTRGTNVTVTVKRLIDPLRDTGAALLPGNRAIGVMVTIHNHGPGVYDGAATSDISLVSASGPTSPVFAPHGVCQTPLRDFENYMYPGETRAGCVVFSVPNRVPVKLVRFSPHGQSRGRLTWRAAG